MQFIFNVYLVICTQVLTLWFQEVSSKPVVSEVPKPVPGMWGSDGCHCYVELERSWHCTYGFCIQHKMPISKANTKNTFKIEILKCKFFYFLCGPPYFL